MEKEKIYKNNKYNPWNLQQYSNRFVCPLLRHMVQSCDLDKKNREHKKSFGCPWPGPTLISFHSLSWVIKSKGILELQARH